MNSNQRSLKFGPYSTSTYSSDTSSCPLTSQFECVFLSSMQLIAENQSTTITLKALIVVVLCVCVFVDVFFQENKLSLTRILMVQNELKSAWNRKEMYAH